MEEPEVEAAIKDAMRIDRNGDHDGAITVAEGLVDTHQYSVAVLLLASQLHLAAAKRTQHDPVQREYHLSRATQQVAHAKLLSKNNLGVARVQAHVLLQANKPEEADAEIARALSLDSPDVLDIHYNDDDKVERDVNCVFVPEEKVDIDNEDEDSDEEVVIEEDLTQKLKRMLRKLPLPIFLAPRLQESQE